MVTHAQAVSKFGDIHHIYAGVTEAEVKAIRVDKFVTTVEGITIVGAYEHIPELANKALIAPEVP